MGNQDKNGAKYSVVKIKTGLGCWIISLKFHVWNIHSLINKISDREFAESPNLNTYLLAIALAILWSTLLNFHLPEPAKAKSTAAFKTPLKQSSDVGVLSHCYPAYSVACVLLTETLNGGRTIARQELAMNATNFIFGTSANIRKSTSTRKKAENEFRKHDLLCNVCLIKFWKLSQV